MQKIKIGVIGLGGISNFHIEGIQASNDAELVAICDIKDGILAEKGDKYNIPESHRFSSHIDLLKCNDVDAVSICTPNDSHYQIAMNAVKYEKPFALEKPVTLTKKEARKLRDTVRKSKIPNMVCFSYRFKAAARYARWIIEKGYLGEIYHVYGQYIQSWGADKDLPLIWRFKKNCSGSGALGDLGSHMLDLTRFMVGDIKKVAGHTGTFINRRKRINSTEYGQVDVDDFCHYLAELENGASASFQISRFGFGRGNYQRVEVYGSKGGLVYNLEDDDSLDVCIGDIYAQAKDYRQLPVPDKYKVEQMQSFFDIMNGKGDGLAATMEDGYINQSIIDAIIDSFKRKEWVRIEGGKDND